MQLVQKSPLCKLKLGGDKSGTSRQHYAKGKLIKRKHGNPNTRIIHSNLNLKEVM